MRSPESFVPQEVAANSDKDAVETTKEKGRNALGALNDGLRGFLRKHRKFFLPLAAAQALFSGMAPEHGHAMPPSKKPAVASPERIQGEKEAAPLPFPKVELTELDPEATQERMLQIISETLPKGWMREVAEVKFSSENPPSAHLDKKTRFADASLRWREGSGQQPSIIFYSTSRLNSRVQSWGNTLIHEFAHAIDWERNSALPPDVWDDLFPALVNRAQHHSRFKSAYVESIEPDNLSSIREEYWAEIWAEYLSADYPRHTLPPADLEIIEHFLTNTDPSFDRDAALARRKEIIAEMHYAARQEEFNALKKRMSPDEYDDLLYWFEIHRDHTTDRVDFTRQREGRNELIALVKDWATNPARRQFAYSVLSHYARREFLYTPSEGWSLSEIGQVFEQHAQSMKEIKEATVGEENKDFLQFYAKLREIIDRYNLYMWAPLDEGEYRAVLDMNAKGEADWILSATEWEIPEKDLIDAEFSSYLWKMGKKWKRELSP